MARFFYTDPLAAAWMAKHFGMRLTARWLGPGPEREYECLTDDWHFEVHDNRTGRYFIHPDSLRLLDPQVNDVIFTTLGGWVSVEAIQSELRAQEAKHFIKRGGRIIQRNGIAFHWPEREVA